MRTANIILFIFFLFVSIYISYLSFNKDKATFKRDIDLAKRVIVYKETPKFLFVGDVMLGRHVEDLMNKEGVGYAFQNTTSLLKKYITIVNLEGPISEDHVKTLSMGFRFSFKDIIADLLHSSGVSAVSLANNHMNDWGYSSYENTKKILSEHNVKSFGDYGEMKDEVFSYPIEDGTNLVVYGINTVSSIFDDNKVKETTSLIRKKYPNDYLVAFIHWGDEYEHKQSVYQRELAHQILDLGVDGVIGSHPHVIQGVEIYNNKPIFYSLGNFIFDQYFSKDTQEGYLLSLEKDGRNYIYKIIPTKSEKSVPRLAADEEKTEILNLIKKNSKDINNVEEIRVIK